MKNYILRTSIYLILISSFTLSAVYAQNPFGDLLAPISSNGKKNEKRVSKNNALYAGTEFAYNNGARSISESGKNAALDTVKKENKIEKFFNYGDLIKVKLKIVESDDNISITVYNMLGRKVSDVYSGTPRKDELYDIYTQNLQGGMYICIVQGPGYKLAEKFVVSH